MVGVAFRRLLSAIPVLLIVSLITFGLMRLGFLSCSFLLLCRFLFCSCLQTTILSSIGLCFCTISL